MANMYKRRMVSADRRQEIIQEIVEALLPSAVFPDVKHSLNARTEVTNQVKKQISALESAVSTHLSREAIQSARTRVTKIIATTEKLKTQILAGPWVGINIADFGWLKQVQDKCNATLKQLGSSDKVKYHCAKTAFNLLFWCRPVRPLNSDSNSPIRVIAGLLCELMLGKPPAVKKGRRKGQKRDWDLRRSCNDILKAFKSQKQIAKEWKKEWKDGLDYRRRIARAVEVNFTAHRFAQIAAKNSI